MARKIASLSRLARLFAEAASMAFSIFLPGNALLYALTWIVRSAAFLSDPAGPRSTFSGLLLIKFLPHKVLIAPG
jgi:hypothetical protein